MIGIYKSKEYPIMTTTTVLKSSAKILRKARATKDVKNLLKQQNGTMVASALAELTYDSDGNLTNQTTTIDAPTATPTVQLGLMQHLLTTVEDSVDDHPYNILVVAYVNETGYHYHTILNCQY